jgi:hypothetical protein
VDREQVSASLGVPAGYLIDSVIALGYPAESPVTEDLEDSIEYWKDDEGRLHVPKRKLAHVVHFNGY